MSGREDVDGLVEAFRAWAAAHADVVAAALAGSHARGVARPDSDLDLMVVATDPAALVDDPAWANAFGPVRSIATEDWGAVTSLRVHYVNDTEVEVGITSPEWARTDPVDPGTARVVRDGFRILHDPDGLLEALVAEVAG